MNTWRNRMLIVAVLAVIMIGLGASGLPSKAFGDGPTKDEVCTKWRNGELQDGRVIQWAEKHCGETTTNGEWNNGGGNNTPPDRDSDGFPNGQDKCPFRGDEGFGVDDTGCPNPPPVVEDGDGGNGDTDSGDLEDSDGDGIADESDGCPFAAQTEFGRAGCPPQQEDVCPNIDDIQTEVPKGYIIDDDGNCVPKPKPEHIKVPVCHTTGSEKNPYEYIEVDVHSVETAQTLGGHGQDPDDIWDSYTYDGVTYLGQGDLSILENGCEIPEPPKECSRLNMSVAFSPTVDGVSSATGTNNADEPCWFGYGVYDTHGHADLSVGPQTLLGYGKILLQPGESGGVTVIFNPAGVCFIQKDAVAAKEESEIPPMFPNPLTYDNQGAQSAGLIRAENESLPCAPPPGECHWVEATMNDDMIVTGTGEGEGTGWRVVLKNDYSVQFASGDDDHNAQFSYSGGEYYVEYQLQFNGSGPWSTEGCVFSFEPPPPPPPPVCTSVDLSIPNGSQIPADGAEVTVTINGENGTQYRIVGDGQVVAGPSANNILNLHAMPDVNYQGQVYSDELEMWTDEGCEFAYEEKPPAQPTCDNLGLIPWRGDIPYDQTGTIQYTDLDGLVDKLRIDFGNGDVYNGTEPSASHTVDTVGTYTAQAYLILKDGSEVTSDSCVATYTATTPSTTPTPVTVIAFEAPPLSDEEEEEEAECLFEGGTWSGSSFEEGQFEVFVKREVNNELVGDPWIATELFEFPAADPAFDPTSANCRLVFAGLVGEQYDLYWVSTFGGAIHQITFTEDVNETQPYWSNDEFIYYSQDGEIAKIMADGSRQKDLGVMGNKPFAQANKVVAENNGKAVFVSTEGQEDGAWMSDFSGENFVLSPDGTLLASEIDGDVTVENLQDGTQETLQGTRLAYDPDGSGDYMVELGLRIFEVDNLTDEVITPEETTLEIGPLQVPWREVFSDPNWGSLDWEQPETAVLDALVASLEPLPALVSQDRGDDPTASASSSEDEILFSVVVSTEGEARANVRGLPGVDHTTVLSQFLYGTELEVLQVQEDVDSWGDWYLVRGINLSGEIVIGWIASPLVQST